MIAIELKEYIKVHLVLITLVACAEVLHAQPSTLLKKDIVFDQLPVNLGLSQNMINCMVQDRDGFLWIGTWSGLIRYDGYSSKTYHSENREGKLRSGKIISLFEDHKGYLWIGTEMGGLFRLDKNTEVFTQYLHNPQDKSTLSNNNVCSIKEDGDNNLWIGTEDGLNIFNDEQENFLAFYHDQKNSKSVSNNHITDMFKSADNRFWIGTSRGLNVLQGGKGAYTFKRHYYTDDTRASFLADDNYILKISELKLKGKSSIWFSTARGLNKLQGETIQNFSISQKPQSYNNMSSILAVEGEQPFILTGSERGLNFFDPVTNRFTRLLSVNDEQSNLSNTSVTTLFIDRGGVLWVGTTKGLNKVDSYSKNFVAYKTSSFDKSRSTITGIQGSYKDGYLISTLGGGIYLFKDNVFKPIRIRTARENDFLNFVQVLYKARDGSIWIGTKGNGIYHCNQKDIDTSTELIRKFEHINTTSMPSLSSDYPMSITEDQQGNIWVGSWHDGLNKITPEGKVEIFKDSLLINVPLVSMCVDHAGRLWIGTSGNGLYKVEQKGVELDIKRFYCKEGSSGYLTNNFVSSICEGKDGILWIGTQSGLHSFDPAAEIFKVKDNSRKMAVADVLIDDGGKLWASHAGGLTVMNPNNKSHSKLYNYQDRVQGGFYLNNVSFKDERGRLFFGGAEGFNIIEPTEMVENPNIPTATITDFQIFGKSVYYPSETKEETTLQEPLSKTKQISLRAKENSISFEFAAFDYAAPEKIQYAYMLEGFDADWKFANSDRRYATYTNLGDGDYTFKVKAAGSNGIWSKHINQLKIAIDPPWWKTHWALALYFGVVVLILYLFERFILIRANFRHDLRVERLQRENMEKLNQSKIQFFTNISHEFRTPLTLILGPLQNLMDGKQHDKEEREQLLRISNNANRLLRLANQLLDFRKTESGNLKLTVSEANIVKFIQEVKLSFDPLAASLKINFSLISSSQAIGVWFDPDQLEKIMFNLLSNAFKNTPEGGEVVIRITEEKDHAVIVVEDNGKGIKREHFENIFQNFFSYEEDKHQHGTGIGLALTKSLVDLHHGQLTFESEEHKFTRFVIRLRQGSSHFNAAELSPISREVESMDHYPSLELQASDTDEELENDQPIVKDLPKLLIVEDNDEVRDYLQSLFKNRYCVTLANNGQQGIALALETTPDLIISDVMMPETDGITLCSELKSNVKTSHIPIILLTARTSLIFKVEGLETGADDYITKPFNPQVLKLKVRNLIHTRNVMKKRFQDSKILTIEPSEVTVNSRDEIFLKHALEAVEHNMGNPEYGIDNLCKDVAMSRTQLYTKLKGLTGQSGNEFIRTIRLKRSAQLLAQNQFTIAEVTNWVGFTDLKYFRDCFKKLFGLTPSEYVKTIAPKSIKKEFTDIL